MGERQGNRIVVVRFLLFFHLFFAPIFCNEFPRISSRKNEEQKKGRKTKTEEKENTHEKKEDVNTMERLNDFPA